MTSVGLEGWSMVSFGARRYYFDVWWFPPFVESDLGAGVPGFCVVGDGGMCCDGDFIVWSFCYRCCTVAVWSSAM
jgi:hypothetical protein